MTVAITFWTYSLHKLLILSVDPVELCTSNDNERSFKRGQIEDIQPTIDLHSSAWLFTASEHDCTEINSILQLTTLYTKRWSLSNRCHQNSLFSFSLNLSKMPILSAATERTKRNVIQHANFPRCQLTNVTDIDIRFIKIFTNYSLTRSTALWRFTILCELWAFARAIKATDTRNWISLANYLNEVTNTLFVFLSCFVLYFDFLFNNDFSEFRPFSLFFYSRSLRLCLSSIKLIVTLNLITNRSNVLLRFTIRFCFQLRTHWNMDNKEITALSVTLSFSLFRFDSPKIAHTTNTNQINLLNDCASQFYCCNSVYRTWEPTERFRQTVLHLNIRNAALQQWYRIDLRGAFSAEERERESNGSKEREQLRTMCTTIRNSKKKTFNL